MSKAKPTKVPVMRQNQPYGDWKKELEVWEATNKILDVDSKILSGTLFESLEGISRQTVLSELTVAEITAEEGVKNITDTLDKFFLGNVTQNAYSVIDDFFIYKRPSETTMEKFIIEFQLKVNKVKASGTTLSDEVLGYALLKAANLSDDKHSMCRATCNDMKFSTVKTQLEKVGFGTSMKSQHYSSATTSKVKVENCFYGDFPESALNHDYSDISDDDLNGERVYYSGSRSNFRNPGNSGERSFKKNPTDSFGYVRACSFCKCQYHWLVDCPYAPADVRNRLPQRSRSKPGSSHNKVL